MGKQKRTAVYIRCSVCGAQCLEGRCGALHGDYPNGRGGSALFLAHLCESCFVATVRYLSREREVMNISNDEPPVGYDAFGWINTSQFPGNT